MTYLFRFEAIPQEPFEDKALQHITDTDPVGLLKKCRKRRRDLKSGTRRLNWQHWTACYAGAFGIRRQPDLFNKLLDEDYFRQRIYKSDFNDLLRLALLIGTDAETAGPTYKKACAIARRLQPLFDAEVEPMKVLERIETAGGLTRLDFSDVIVTEEQPDDGEHEDRDGDDDGEDEDAELHDVDEDGDEETEGDDDQAALSTATRSPTRLEQSGRRITRSYDIKARTGQKSMRQSKARTVQTIRTSDNAAREINKGMVILEVEVTQQMLSKVLNAEYSFLHVRCTDFEEGWQRVVGVTVANSD